MKVIGSIILALILTGCASTQPIAFSPSQDYSVAVQPTLFDAVRTDINDTTLFSDGKAFGFIRIEPVPEDVSSTKDFLETLRSASESDTVTPTLLNLSGGFKGFTVKNRDYITGYLATSEESDAILVVSFPEDKFDAIVESISAGI